MEEGFIAAEIKSTKGDTVVVVTSKGNEVSPVIMWHYSKDFLRTLCRSITVVCQ